MDNFLLYVLVAATAFAIGFVVGVVATYRRTNAGEEKD